MNVRIFDADFSEIDIQDSVLVDKDNSGEKLSIVRIITNDGEGGDICLTREELEDFIDALRFIGKRLK